jgi:hypothetical protein
LYKLWLGAGCSEQPNQGKQTKLQYLQNPSQINVDNLNNIRDEVGIYFNGKDKKEYPKDKINDLATYNNNRNVKDLNGEINKSKKGYHSKINLTNARTDLRNILNMLKNYFPQLLNANRITDIEYMDIRTA